jgi:hypothetical protein
MAIREGRQPSQVVHGMQLCLPNSVAMVLAFEIYGRREIFVSLL